MPPSAAMAVVDRHTPSADAIANDEIISECILKKVVISYNYQCFWWLFAEITGDELAKMPDTV